MVGHHTREHDICKRLIQAHQEVRTKNIDAYDVAANLVDEHRCIESREYLQGCNDEYGTVDTSDTYQQLVEQIGRIHKECQQRMAINIIACRPVANNT